MFENWKIDVIFNFSIKCIRILSFLFISLWKDNFWQLGIYRSRGSIIGIGGV